MNEFRTYIKLDFRCLILGLHNFLRYVWCFFLIFKLFFIKKLAKHEWEPQHLGPISFRKSKDKIFRIIFIHFRLYQARKNVKIRQETQQFLKGFTILFYLCLYININKIHINMFIQIFKKYAFFKQ